MDAPLNASQRLAPTLSLEAAAYTRWDALIVGAGPAGAIAAHEMARRGASVLLVDQAEFPRGKVCGGCVNLAGLRLLASVGLGGLVAACGAQPLRQIRLIARRRQATVNLPGGVALSRERLDAALIDAAIRQGAQFLPGTKAVSHHLGHEARVTRLAQGQQHAAVTARVVLAADGLRGRLAEQDAEMRHRIAPRSRIGVGALLPRAPSWLPPGTILMACSGQGYVGSVRLEANRCGIAAAVDPQFIRAVGGPRAALNHLLKDTDLPPLDEAPDACWQGTPLLSRQRPRVSAERFLIVGDAASYVEPFTGEGIAWALASGIAAAPLACEAARRWDAAMARHWDRRYGRLIHRRQRLCRVIASGLRHPRLTRLVIGWLARAPRLADPVLRLLNADLPALASS